MFKNRLKNFRILFSLRGTLFNCLNFLIAVSYILILVMEMLSYLKQCGKKEETEL